MTLSDPHLFYLRHLASFLNAEVESLILQKKSIADIIKASTASVASASKDIVGVPDLEAESAFLWLNKALKQIGHLGVYFDNDFLPLRNIAKITPSNFADAQKIVMSALVDDIDFNPQLSVSSMPQPPPVVNNLSSIPSSPPPSGSSQSTSSPVNVSVGLKPDTSSFPLRYQGTLPPLGTTELDATGYAKLKELSKTVSPKLNIDSILSRFAAWAHANNMSLTDQGYKVALGTVLPDSHIKTYDPLCSDTKVPFHHLAYLLSKKLGGKKTFKVARAFGDELACNMTDPPLKVLEEIEDLYNRVEGRDRKTLGEEAFLLAESYLTRRFGDQFYIIFESRLQSENIDNISDLIILFRNHFQKVAATFESEKVSHKKNRDRICHLELEAATRDQMGADIKNILSHLETPQGPGRGMEQIPGLNTPPFSVDQGYYNPSSAFQGQCHPSHHIAPPAQAPAPAPAPIVMPVLIPGHPNRGPRPAQGKPFGGKFKVPREQQYAHQACCYPGHFAHKNQDCQIQANISCQYNPRHGGHKANACIRSRDWTFGAIEAPNQFRAPGGQAPHGGGPRARLQAPPQPPPPRQSQAAQVNSIIDAIKSGFQNLSGSA